MIDTALFHDLICSMTGFDLSVHRHIDACNGTMPYIVIALAATQQVAAVRLQNVADLLLVFSH